MKTLTATNQRVQFYITFGEACNKQAKEERFKQLEKSLLDRGQFIDELFPKKQAAMLDKILYDTTGNGILKIGADKLAEYADASTRTVTNFNNALLSTDQFLIGRLKNSKTNCGKLIYVDKLHANFNEIMREVFLLDATQIAELIAEQKQPENVDMTGIECENQPLNHFNSFNKTSFLNNNIYIDAKDMKTAIKESIDQETPVSIDEQRERLNQYATNEYQIMLFDFLKEMPRLAPAITNNLYKLALAIGSDATAQHFHIAKDVIFNLSMRLEARSIAVNMSIRALFDTLYRERLNTLKTHVNASYEAVDTFADKTHVPRPELFYNWLEERE